MRGHKDGWHRKPLKTLLSWIWDSYFMHLSSQFEQALHYAVLIHAGQIRKGTGVPYLAHLLGVASIALEYGATEVEAIGALLHDAGEDAGGRGRIEDIRQRFGNAVADIVQGCTD